MTQEELYTLIDRDRLVTKWGEMGQNAVSL